MCMIDQSHDSMIGSVLEAPSPGEDSLKPPERCGTQALSNRGSQLILCSFRYHIPLFHPGPLILGALTYLN